MTVVRGVFPRRCRRQNGRDALRFAIAGKRGPAPPRRTGTQRAVRRGRSSCGRNRSSESSRTAGDERYRQLLNVERLTTPAFVFNVRVVELEALVQAFSRKVELGAIEIGQALGIDDDHYAVALELEILRLRFIRVFDLVGKSRASGR